MDDCNITYALEEAARFFGSEAALARALGVSRGAVNQWKKPNRQVPAEYAPRIEKLRDFRKHVRCVAIRSFGMAASSFCLTARTR